MLFTEIFRLCVLVWGIWLRHENIDIDVYEVDNKHEFIDILKDTCGTPHR